jgi:hypothetical protein
VAWLTRRLRPRQHGEKQPEFSVLRYYESVALVPEQLPPNEMAIVGVPLLPKWALFECPCRGGHRVQLSLQHSHRPKWRLRVIYGKPSLAPSIWVDAPAGCHFWIISGRVMWVPKRRWRKSLEPGPHD